MTTPREIIAEQSDGGARAPDRILEALTAAGYQIVRKDKFDTMHRRSQVAEGLLSAVTHDLEMWTRCLQDKPQWLDTWLFRNALGRFSRLRDRAIVKAESASAGFHILSDADLQARDDAALERAAVKADEFHYGTQGACASTAKHIRNAIRAMQGGKP